MVKGRSGKISRERGGVKLIYVNINDKEQQLQIEGSVGMIVADICVVLKEICDGGIEPEWLIGMLKDTFLDGMKQIQEKGEGFGSDLECEVECEGMSKDMLKDLIEKLISGLGEGAEEDDKDERSKETLSGANRRYRRVRPH